MNRREFFIPTAAGALASAYAASLLGPTPTLAQDGQEPLGGQPPWPANDDALDAFMV